MLFSVLANAQKDPSTIIQTSDSTGFGTPDGKSVSKQIGTAGGTIVSDDGRVELIFPVGALTASTDISIQPAKNMLDNGTGKAYQFEPAGIQFKKPVRIIFHYTTEEAEACPADLMSFSLQDRSGKWSSFEYEDWDSTSQTLKGYIHHFTYFTNLKDIMLKPESEEVPVNGQTKILVLDKSEPADPKLTDTPFDQALFDIRYPTGWLVNEYPRGNAAVGFVGTSTTTPNKKQKYFYGIYNAPEYMPVQNPVTIKLAVQYYSKKLDKKRWKTFECRVKVWDMYRALLVHEFTGREGMDSKLVDSASFLIKLYPERVVVLNINNYPPKTMKEGSRMGVSEKIYLDGAPGTIDVKEDTKGYKLSNKFPPDVYFEFKTSEILHYNMQYMIRRMRIETERVKITSKAIPENISFTANGQAQQYKYANRRDLEVFITPCRGQCE
jgi:hypothetical protein